MRKGQPPIGHDQQAVNLHHLIQREPGTLAEVGGELHSKHHGILHGLVERGRRFRSSPDAKSTEAEKAFGRYTHKYWQTRAQDFE